MRRILVTGAAVFAVLAAAVAAGAAPSDAGLNARLIRWQEREATIHILVYDDHGRPGQPAALVPEGKPLLFGFEWIGELEELEDYLETATADVSVDGGPWIDVRHAYLSIFFSDGKGPRWTWDHDSDGRGDGDGDGVGDFPNTYIAPFRYAHPGMPTGTHTFEFCFDDPIFDPICDTITVEVVP